MPPSYRVEVAVPVEVRDDLERLWQDNLTLESHPADKFAWLYLEAPARPAAVLVLRDERGAAVGTGGVGIRAFAVDGDLGQAGLLADLAVDKAHRSVGPALALVRAGKDLVDAAFTVGYGFPNRLAEGVFKRAGYRVLGMMERYARPLRHASFVGRLEPSMLPRVPEAARPWAIKALQHPTVARLAGTAADLVNLATGGPAAVAARRRLRVEEAARPDGRLDQLWATAKDAYGVVAERTARFLRWRFPPAPDRRWRLAVDRVSGEVRAYVVLDQHDGTLHVRDLFGHRDAVLGLLAGLPVAAYRDGATTLSMRYLGQPWLRDALLAHGLTARQSRRAIVTTVGPTASPAAAARLADVDAWHLTDADEDV